jgi:hypothetical protein
MGSEQLSAWQEMMQGFLQKTAYDSWSGMVNKSGGWKRRCSRIGNPHAK